MKYIKSWKLCCVCLLPLMFLLMSVPVQAEDISEDSVNIAPEILSMLDLQDGEKVVCVYRARVNHVFWTCSSIEEFLSFDHGVRTYIFYVVISPDGSSRCYILEGKKCVLYEDWEGWKSAYAEYFPLIDLLLSDDLLVEVDPDIVIENKYYLDSGLNEGNAIYCETNQGDYIYYHYFGTSKYGRIPGTYIFSLEAFLDFNKVVESEYQKVAAMYPDGWVGGGAESALELDLSAYEIGSENFNPDAEFVLPKDKNNPWIIVTGIAMSLCLLGAATFLAVRFHKRNRTQA